MCIAFITFRLKPALHSTGTVGLSHTISFSARNLLSGLRETEFIIAGRQREDDELGIYTANINGELRERERERKIERERERREERRERELLEIDGFRLQKLESADTLTLKLESNTTRSVAADDFHFVYGRHGFFKDGDGWYPWDTAERKTMWKDQEWLTKMESRTIWKAKHVGHKGNKYKICNKLDWKSKPRFKTTVAKAETMCLAADRKGKLVLKLASQCGTGGNACIWEYGEKV
eukprot:257830_1